MNELQFLDVIYGSIKVGMKIKKPRKLSEILEIKVAGDIYHRVGKTNKKSVAKKELSETYSILRKTNLSNSHLNHIVPSSKPCNVTTIKWLVTHSGVAREKLMGHIVKHGSRTI